MVTMTVDEMVKTIRLKIDEISANESGMMDEDEDDSELTSIIKAVIPDAVRFVMLAADVNLLEGKNDTTSFTLGSDLIGKVKLPDDFMRLISVRMSSWVSAAAEVITEFSPEYRQQSDPYACATYLHPVAALVWQGGNRYIELYKAKDQTDTLTHFVYVQTPSSDAESYSIPTQLKECVTWYAAGLTLTAVRDDHAAACVDIAKGLMGGTDNG